MKRFFACAAIAVGGAAPLTASAAPISGYAADAKNQAHVTAGWNAVPDVELAYGWHTELAARRVDLEAGLTVPVFLVKDFDSFRLEPALRTMIARSGRWGLAGRLGVPMESGKNQTFSYVSFGAHATLAPGYFAPRGFVALEAGYTGIVSTYVSSSDRERANYPGVRDGFYAPAGGYLDLALAFAVTPLPSFEVGLRGGYRTTQALGPPPLVPFVAELGLSYQF